MIAARDPETADTAAQGLAGVRALPVPLDVSDRESVDAVAEAWRTNQGELDILINNAAGYVDWADRERQQRRRVAR